MSRLDLSIIIVSYNTKDLLLDCLESIVSTKEGLKVQVIVVDNASGDGSVEAIQKFKNRLDDFVIIENKENLGFSKANNLGVKKADGRYILFLNSDTKLHTKTLPGMVVFMDTHSDASVATCSLELLDGTLDDAAHRGFPTPWRAFCHFSGLSSILPNSNILNGYHLGWQNMDEIHEVEAVAGAFMLVRPEIGEKIGWWDEDYFWYGEDLDFCYEVKKHGGKIFYVPDYSALHYKGASGGIKKSSKEITSANQETKRKATQARFEAMKIFYKKHYIKKYPIIVTSLILLAIKIKEQVSK